MLYDAISRQTMIRDRLAALQRDFGRPQPPPRVKAAHDVDARAQRALDGEETARGQGRSLNFGAR